MVRVAEQSFRVKFRSQSRDTGVGFFVRLPTLGSRTGVGGERRRKQNQEDKIGRAKSHTAASVKPSAQTQLILDEMDINESINEERWDSLQQSLDLLFAKVANIEHNQVQAKAQLDLNSELIDRIARDQVTMNKQIAENGRTIAQLRFDKAKPPVHDIPESSQPPHPHRDRTPCHQFKASTDPNTGQDKPNFNIPKMSFPKFDGSHPRIWIDKAVNYFTIYNIPRCLWVTASTVAFDDNAAKWLQVYKLQHDIVG